MEEFLLLKKAESFVEEAVTAMMVEVVALLAVMTNLSPSKKSSKISHKDIFVDFIILKRICVTHILSN